VICPLHERRFALDTGAPIGHDGPGVAAHRVEVRGEDVLVALAQPAAVAA
jgi:nitrite reductase/ring-hydroxylating ferredoxin subunit